MSNLTPPTIDPKDLSKMIGLARLEVFEPFEGEQNLERLQKARKVFEQGVDKIVGQTGAWIEASGVVAKTQARWSGWKDRNANKKVNPNSKFDKISNATSNLAKRINQETNDIQTLGKAKFKELQSNVWQGTKSYTIKGFDLLWQEAPESWMLPRVSKVLGREVQSLQELQQISNGERGVLLENLYPYNSQGYQKLAKGFDVSINVSLGLIVATNLPGTGLLVSAINTIKTIMKIANGLQVLSALYGYKIQNQQALFTLCGQIIASMEEFESGSTHAPLSYTALEPLFVKEIHKNQTSIESLITEALKKEAYIAIPGVGMLSLGKIQLDDYKAEKISLSLMEKRRTYLELEKTIGQTLLTTELQNLVGIFQELHALDTLAQLQNLLRESLRGNQKQSWMQKIKFRKQADVFPILDKLAEFFYFKKQTLANETHLITADSLAEVLMHLGATSPGP